MTVPDSTRAIDPIEQDFMDALDRLVEGKPIQKKLKNLLKSKGKLSINVVNVALESGHSRTLIGMDGCRYPKVREAIRLAKGGKTSEPQNYRQLIQNLRAALADEKSKNKLLQLQITEHFTARKTAEDDARRWEKVAANRQKELIELHKLVHLTPRKNNPPATRLILIRGLPGAGKTTLANRYKEQGYEHLEADLFFRQDGDYVFDEERLPEAHAWCLQQTQTALEAGSHVVVANVFSLVEEIKPYTELGFEYQVLEAKGRGKSIHSVPPEVMRAMKASWVPTDTLLLQLKKHTQRKSGDNISPIYSK